MNRLKSYIRKPLKTYRSVLISLSLVFALSLLVVILTSIINGGFMHYNTDDIIQYYPIMASFIDKIKSGSFSLYNASFFQGGSEFANSYYVPLDGFTLLTFIFSFLFKTETAYCIVNLLKPILGGLLLFHIFKKQGFKPKTCFASVMIYTFCGLYAAFCVFPVYMSLIFYIPLAVYVADKFRENKYNFILIILYSVLVIFYDFYLAYMLFAFFMIYLVIKGYHLNDFSLFGKNTFIKNKKFYGNVVTPLVLILSGMLISLAYFLPNYTYITGKTYRIVTEEVLSSYYDKHYLLIFSTFFLTSNPQSILLAYGDYVRNHASMFMTIYGLIFLIQFFFLKGKDLRKLKFFVILFNILLCIPLVSMIMTASSQAYIRWFFIVYFINLYAATIAMDRMDMDFTKKLSSKLITIFVLTIGLLYISYIYFFSDKYTLYDNTDFFDGIIIIFLATIFLYTIFLLFKRNKNWFMFLLFCEVVSSITVVFVNLDNVSPYYYNAKNTLDNVYDNLNTHTSYTKTNAYRASINSYESSYFTNLSFIYEKVNTGSFFHSFYDSTMNDFLGDYLGESTSSWSKNESVFYQMPFSILNGIKYQIVPKWQNIQMPANCKLMYDDDSFLYYEVEDLKPFIVYDTFLESMNGTSPYTKGVLSTVYGSFSNYLPHDYQENVFNSLELNTVSYSEGVNSLDIPETRYYTGSIEKVDEVDYVKYDIQNLPTNVDTYSFYISSTSNRYNGYMDSYIIDSNDEKHYLYYGTTSYDGSYEPKYLYVKATNKAFPITMLSYNLATLYNQYLDNQASYKNQEFKLEKSKMTIKLDCPISDYGRVIKTNFSYSDEWKLNNDSYKTLNIVGGYLGIYIPPNTSSVDITLDFVPNGLNIGLTVSSFSLSCCMILSSAIYVTRKKVKNIY